MLMFDYPLCGADTLSVSLYPTNLQDINYLLIQNAMFDSLRITKDVTFDMNTDIIPADWDNNTIMNADFNKNVLGGNFKFLLEKCKGFFIKRRNVDELHWITLFYFPVSKIEDFDVIFQDRTCALANKYVYAFVPIIDNFEGKYSVSDEVDTTCNKIVIIDYLETWATAITNGYCDTVRNYPISMIETLNSKYPTAVRNTMANYDTINVSGTWLPNEDGSCELIDVQDPENWRWITQWSKEFVDFLTNDETKLLKSMDGRMWLCHLSSEVSDTADSIHFDRTLSFTMTELGDWMNEEALNEARFISDDVINNL